MRPFFLTKCLKNFFFKSLHLSSCSKSVSQDYCWRWKQSIPELRGSNYSVIQLLSIICHTCRRILAIHSLLNSSHHLCEVKQTICKCHTHLFSWTTSPFPTHPLFSPLQSPTFFSFCVHRKDILHSPTSKRTTELSYWGKRANRWANGVWRCFRSLVSENKAVKYSPDFSDGLYSVVCQGKMIS